MDRKSFLKLLTLAPFFYPMPSLTAFAHHLTPTERMPVLFLGHGSPMNALEDNEFVKGFKTIASTLPKPNAILCISAHWLTKGTKVTAMTTPRTIHDFGGFPEALYQVQYPAKGDPKLALELQQHIQKTPIELDHSWGLDHGTWSVVKHLYPDANIPVLQLSIDYTQSADYHYQLAKELSYLRDKGVLIIGSGNIIHNLGLIDFKNFDTDNYGYDWAIEARKLINSYLLEGNHKALIHFEKLPKSIQLAVPTPDHFIPLIYTLALQDSKESLHLFNDKLVAGSLSMTSLKLG